MTMWMLLLLLAASPFWQEKPPAEWNDLQIAQSLNDSPWAHAAKGNGKVIVAPVQAYLESSQFVERVLQERNRRAALRRKETAEGALAEEYRFWFEDNRTDQVILAVRVGTPNAFSDEREIRRLQEDSTMHSGNVSVKMSGHFPPSANDPYVHLAFPRNIIQPSEKTLSFQLYLPGIASPYRSVDFLPSELMTDGRPDY
jgi:hypothetical protein